ncbi:hypothetical protein DNL40_15990 [Xylanimonas oleitrophica]|uniref:SAF domain-containing protein n=1 Tax=Xylanimonas oleitrophica TaxID=2607479 RepID=A0A2W5YBW1_9MICO|nr:hypothetical protein [Xylanimonas oleitrophica]PZR51541.1 hypothetical protein DNL40_15990 [Xylanimonas oleitrophica]
MTSETLPAPVAARLRRPTWRDPRLVVGVVLVALAVALGSWAVSAASRTVPVWAADAPLTPGEPLSAAALRTVDVRLGGGADLYLPADTPLPADAVVTRVVQPGELVARSAVGAAADVDLRSVAVPVSGGLSDRIRKGRVVDLWFVPAPARTPGTEAPQPRSVVEGVLVEQVDAASTGLVVGSTATLHVLVPTDELPSVLGALGADGSVTVVPAAGNAS